MILCYLEEVLAGDDESQLGTEVICLGLAPSHPLDQLRDVISHGLEEAGKFKLSTPRMVNYQSRVENGPSDKCCWKCHPSWETPVPDLGLTAPSASWIRTNPGS